MQQKETAPYFWSSKDEETPKLTVLSWAKAAFTSGAGWFVVSTQSTNSPPPSEMFDWFDGMLGPAVHRSEVKAHSYNANRQFGEWFAAYRA